MIPAPPPDPALPALTDALDGAVMAKVLNAAWADAGRTDQSVRYARPCYIRYKPGTSCLVAYELQVTSGSSRAATTQWAHAALLTDGRAAAAAVRPSSGRLAARAARWHPEPPQPRMLLASEPRALVQIYPVDRALRPLVRAASPRAARRVLGPWLGLGAEQCTVELLRYKPGRKALLRYGWPEAPADLPAVYAKLHADERGAALVHRARALIAAGVPTAAPLGYLAAWRLFVQTAVEGTPLVTLRGRPDFAAAMEPVAELLARLHRSGIVGAYGLLSNAADDAASVVAAGSLLAAVGPSPGRRARRLAAEVGARLEELGGPRGPIHGDFYDDQVILSGAGPVLVDLDELRAGHALRDVGNFLAHLAVHGALSGQSAGEARERWVSGYARHGRVEERQLALQEAAGLMRLAVGPFRRLEPEWPAKIEQIVDLAAEALERSRALAAPVGRRPSRPEDAALPQLDSLTDAAEMNRLLSEAVFEAPVRITDLAVVRHKPGRRAVVRYDLVIGSPGTVRPVRVYGKTFASTRGPRVMANHVAMSAARAVGAEVDVPEPVAYLVPLKTVLMRAVPGEPITRRLLAGDQALAGRTAEALWALHHSGAELTGVHSLERELAPLARRTAELAVADPELASLAWSCWAEVEDGAGRVTRWRRRPIHRDFYEDQVRAGAHRLAVLDFDDAALSEPAVDVANFLAHLRLLALQAEGHAAALGAVAATFRQRYGELDPELDPQTVNYLEAATLLRLAHIHRSRPDGARLARGLLSACRRAWNARPALLV